MKKNYFLYLSILLVLVFTMSFYSSPVSAALPVSVQVKTGDTLATIARAYQVSVADLMKQNNQLGNPNALSPGSWVYLPSSAQLPSTPVFAISAPSETELMYITPELTDVTTFRILGRHFYFARWIDVPVLVFATGGGMDNPAIGVTLALSEFNVKRFCYQGIGGGGHGVNVGDVVVATGVIPGTGSGNVAPLLSPSGDVTVGTFWSYYGEQVIKDNGTESKLLLTPDQSFMDKVLSSVDKVDMPFVNKEYADYESYFYGIPMPPYQSQVRTGWTSTGPFVTSDLYQTQTELRSAILAGMVGAPAPEYIAYDMEDFEAIHAALEGGIEEWCVIRSVTDNAREKIPSDNGTAGVPWDQQNDPSQPWSYIYGNNTWGWFSDYSYFYQIPALVMKQIVADWGLN